MTKILIIEDEIRLADVLYDWFHSFHSKKFEEYES